MVGIARDEASPLLGRLEEQSLMSSLLDDIAARGQALVVRGEPGIGKSGLQSMCERAARERGWAVLSTTGVQSEANLPFAGLHRLFDRFAVARASSATSSAPRSMPPSALRTRRRPSISELPWLRLTCVGGCV